MEALEQRTNLNGQQDLMRAIATLKERKSKLSIEKTGHQAELSRLRDRVRGAGTRGLPSVEYTAICRKQNEIKSRIHVIEGEIAEINNGVSNKEVLREELKMDNESGALQSHHIASLATLRAKYMQFAADPTRVSSMRAMAAQFVQELELIG